MGNESIASNGAVKSLLKKKLLIIEALIFLMPSLVFLYLFYQNKISFDTSQLVILLAVLALVFSGMMILRQFFDRILRIYSVMQKAESDEQVILDVHKDASELHEITLSFNNLMSNFKEANNELQRRVFELFSIRELTEVAGKSLNLDELFNVLLEKTIAVSSAQVGAVYMVDRQNNDFVLAASKGMDSTSTTENRIECRKSPMNQVLTEKRPVLIYDPDFFNLQSDDSDVMDLKKYLLCMPIFIREQLVAVLSLFPWQDRDSADSNDEQIVSIMISEIGFALGNAMLHKKLEKHSQSLQERAEELTRMNDELQKAIEGREKAKEDLQKANEDLENRVQERTMELAKINEELEVEISERRQAEIALQQAKEEAEAANVAKSRFLANMSHELLTPLNTVIGFSQILLNKNHGDVNEKQIKYLQNILGSGKHLMKLISGVLQISKIEAELMNLDMSEFDLLEEVQSSINTVQPFADKKGITLALDTKPSLPNVAADREKIREIIHNLLNNAVKFSKANSKVQLVVDTVNREDVIDYVGQEQGGPESEGQQKFIRFSVSDKGVGLKPEDKDRIFSIFEQADTSRERSFDGTGLGLAVTRKLVELHNGRIWAESKGEGKGSRFTFVLPLPMGLLRESIPLSEFFD